MPKSPRTDRDGLYQRPGTPYWWASYTDARGRRTRRSTGQTDRREAQAVLAHWRLEARAARTAPPPGHRYEDLMLRYLAGPGSQYRSQQRIGHAEAHLSRAFAGRELATLTPSVLREYLDGRLAEGAAPATINIEIGLLSAAWNYAVREWEWTLHANPCTGRRLREPEGRVRWLTREEAARLLAAAEQERQAPHLPDFIRLALHTGCRRGELLGLEWSRVNLDAGLILLEAQHTKAGRRRSIPLNATARATLVARLQYRAQHCPTSPWVFAHPDGTRIQQTRNSFMSACRRADIHDFRIHDLRHTCAAWLVSAGVSLTEVRDLLGHSAIRMTERYAHLAPERVRAAVAVLDAVGPARLRVVGAEDST